MAETNDDFEWIIIKDPTIGGTFTYVGQANSCIEVARGATANTVTNGIPIVGGWAQSSAPVQDRIATAVRPGSTIAGVPDEFVLCARPLSSNADIQGAFTWRELL